MIRDLANKVLFCIGKRVKFGKGNFVDRATVFEGMNRIGNHNVLKGTVGLGTYIGSGCRIEGKIGRFCSISNDVIVLSTKHPTEYVSTNPIFYSTKKQNGYSYVQHDEYDERLVAADNDAVVIGNDVLISYGVYIMGGVKIGDGAVIGANAVVTHDVPPYCIVAGNPAKIIRKRFSDQVIEQLLRIEWWNWNEAVIRERAESFLDVEKFVEDWQ